MTADRSRWQATDSTAKGSSRGAPPRRLEIIHLRSSAEPIDSLLARVEVSLLRGADGCGEIVLYRRRGLDTDIAIHLHPPEADPGNGPSELGLRLAAALRAYGLVEHTLWEESA